jgi:hypothetical protein
MSTPRVASLVPTGCIRAGSVRLLVPVSSALSQPTRLVAQRLVTAAVTKHGPYSSGLLPSWPLPKVGSRGKRVGVGDHKATVSRRSRGFVLAAGVVGTLNGEGKSPLTASWSGRATASPRESIAQAVLVAADPLGKFRTRNPSVPHPPTRRGDSGQPLRARRG